MSAQPDLSTLPQRMMYAADVVAAANDRYRNENPRAGFSANEPMSPSSMRYLANQWAREDRERADMAEEIEQLAEELLKAQRLAYPGREDLHTSSKAAENARILAAHLIESGWRKEVSE